MKNQLCEGNLVDLKQKNYSLLEQNGQNFYILKPKEIPLPRNIEKLASVRAKILNFQTEF